MATKVLILGAGGFIGSHLVEALSHQQDSSIEVIKVKVNLQDYKSTISEVLGYKPDLVVQLAWTASSTFNYRDNPLNNVWAKFTVELARACQETNSQFMGIGSGVELEDHPQDAYSASKRETFLQLENLIFQEKMIWVRLGYVFDQASESPGLIKEICTARRENRTPLIRSLNAKHDFVHVKDVAQALIIIIRNRENGLFEIGCGKTHSVRQVAEALGFSFTAVEEKTDSNHSSINITRLTQIGYAATYTNEFFHD
jgi:nucleoside-diphosphate-sugar epimerase